MCKDNKLTIKHQRNLKQRRSIAYSIDFQPNQDTTTFNLDKSVLQPRKLLQKLTEIFFYHVSRQSQVKFFHQLATVFMTLQNTDLSDKHFPIIDM